LLDCLCSLYIAHGTDVLSANVFYRVEGETLINICWRSDTYQHIISDKTQIRTWNAWFDRWWGSSLDSTNH